MSPDTTRPDTVTVYGYKVFDLASCDMQVAGCKATLDAIGRLALAEPLLGTGEEVPRHALDAAGKFRRVATGWGVLD